MMMTDLTIAIQAGGQSRRMGQDKGLVLINQRPMIAYVLEAVRSFTTNILITTNQPTAYESLGFPLVADEHPGAGALPGLLTALQARARLLEERFELQQQIDSASPQLDD